MASKNYILNQNVNIKMLHCDIKVLHCDIGMLYFDHRMLYYDMVYFYSRMLNLEFEIFTSEYCSAWSRSQVRNQIFGPKQNTELTVNPPPTENFSKGSRLRMGPRSGM